MAEMWRPVVGFEHCYEVSDAGNVRAIDRIDTKGAKWKRRAKALVPGNKAGHLKVMLNWEGKYYSRWVHRLVLEAFKGAPPPGTECRHLNGDAIDNRAQNLEWGTRLVNIRDNVKLGKQAKGWRTATAKFGPEDREEALRLHKKGASYSQIKRAIGCSIGKAWQLVNAPKDFQRGSA